MLMYDAKVGRVPKARQDTTRKGWINVQLLFYIETRPQEQHSITPEKMLQMFVFSEKSLVHATSCDEQADKSLWSKLSLTGL